MQQAVPPSPAESSSSALRSFLVGAALGLMGAVAGFAGMHVEPASANAAGNWGYKDTGKWNEEFPLCTGKEQSPVDLKGGADVGGDSLKGRLKYKALENRDLFNNNGKNVQVNGPFGTLFLPDGYYDVKQFHFHFPAEHSVNGKLAEGELHIVHQKRGSEGTKDLAVIGIILEDTDPKVVVDGNKPELQFLKKLGFDDDLPAKRMRMTVEEPLDLNAFADQLDGGFWHYEGSLTTPPCAEKVHWYVMQKTAPVSKAMIAKFKEKFPENNRPVQGMNKRKPVLGDVEVAGEFPYILNPRFALVENTA